MSASRFTIAIAACALATPQAHALLSINVTQDYTTAPGWVINTFTADSEYDLTVMAAYSELTSGSMLNIPGYYPATRSNGPGDSYFSINNDPSTSGWLGYGDLGQRTSDPFFDERGIGMVWYNSDRSDFGTGLHLATLTFSTDTLGTFIFQTIASDENTESDAKIEGTFDINEGIASLVQSYTDISEPQPGENPDTGTTPDPGTTPDTGTTPLPPQPDPIPYPNPGGSAVPEPVGLGIFAAGVALLGGLHRRRLSGTK